VDRTRYLKLSRTEFSDVTDRMWRFDVDFDELTFASQGLSLPRDGR
jgi:hypothetical protein